MTSKRARPGPGAARVGAGMIRPGPELPVAPLSEVTGGGGEIGDVRLPGRDLPRADHPAGHVRDRAERSPFRRFHAATALNLSLTGLLYALCCLILCGLLLLDSLTVALVVVIPIAFGLWLSVLKYLIRGIGAANRGERYDVPGWICARIAKPFTR